MRLGRTGGQEERLVGHALALEPADRLIGDVVTPRSTRRRCRSLKVVGRCSAASRSITNPVPPSASNDGRVCTPGWVGEAVVGQADQAVAGVGTRPVNRIRAPASLAARWRARVGEQDPLRGQPVQRGLTAPSPTRQVPTEVVPVDA